ncbi:MAG TPA: SH3 domain-containing protein [Symbiobacteriaceae bacterium]|nr:SH3 domain-containing protein [Symbiobacteriaceae bacterium]
MAQPAPERPAPQLPVPGPVPLAEQVLRRVTLAPGRPVTEAGQYYLNVATGELEGWVSGIDNDVQVHGGDEGWVTARREGAGYLLNRRTGETYRYDQTTHWFLGSAPERVLFRAGDRLFLLTEKMEPVGTATAQGRLVLSPDGKRAALSATSDSAVLLDLTTGVEKNLGSVPGQADVAPRGREGFAVMGIESEGSTLIRYYDWGGRQTGEATLRGSARSLSPDGRFVAATETLAGVIGTVGWYEAATGAPVLRVLGVDAGQWLADSEQLLTGSRDRAWTAVRGGALRPAPQPLRGENHVSWGYGRLVPSPVDANLYATGAAIIEKTGAIRHQVQFAKHPHGSWLITPPEWNAAGTEIRFRVDPPRGTDWDELPMLRLPPRIQLPPFQDDWLLKVNVPPGECLNLRKWTALASEVIRCLPPGAKLRVGAASDTVSYAYREQEGRAWVWVQTEQGETGWVAASPDMLGWTD